MKFKILIFSVLLIFSASTLFASAPRDSIGVENKDGKKVIIHKLDPKDNYYSLGRKYKVSPKVIMQFNNNAPLPIGGIIKIPTDRPFIEPSASTPPPAKTPAVVPPVKNNRCRRL